MIKNKRVLLFLSSRLFLTVCCIFLSLFVYSQDNYLKADSGLLKPVFPKPNYANINNWAAHPWKKDPSDSIPLPLRASFFPDSLADVFFLHPTTLTDKKDTRWNANIDDREINNKTDISAILYQASAFNEHCRVFAPRYRQAHINSFFISELSAAPYFEIAYEDIKSAFEYYLQHYHTTQPIVIAAHSQGTKHAARLLKEFFENKPLQKYLVCAYLIGMPVTTSYFANLQPCKDSLSTGCFVSWRTFKKGYSGGDYIKAENFKAVVTNPLSWTSDSLFVSSSFNKGGVLKKFNTIVPGVVDAQVHQNILWTSKPAVPGKFLLITKNYHVGDINLFYVNIRTNVAARIKKYLQTNQ